MNEHVATIRKRPGMYVGDPGPSGVLQLLLEVLGNAYDQHLGGACTRIHVDVDAGDVITITDDGPGIPVERLDRLDVRHDTPTADGHRPHCHLARGIGLAPVVALSEHFTAIVVRDGAEHVATYRAGVASGPIDRAPSSAATGTTIRLRADATVLESNRVPRLRLTERLRELAYLAPRLALSWSFGPDRGASRGLAGLIDETGPTGPIAHHRGAVGDIDVEVAFAWRQHPDASEAPSIASFANYLPTRAGMHVRGLEDALAGLRRDGLIAAVSVVLADVKYGNPSKDELVTEAARAAVHTIAAEALRAWTAAHPDEHARVRAT